MFKKYKPFFKGAMMNFAAYRFQVFTWAFITALQVVCIVFLWTAIYKVKSEEAGTALLDTIVNGYNFKEILTYLVFMNIFTFVTFGSDTVWTIREDIKMGTIALSFTKPISYRKRLLATALGSSFMPCLVLGLPLFVISYVIFVCVGFIQITNVWMMLFSIVVFLILQILACMIDDAMSFFVGCLCFYTQSGWGLAMLKRTIQSFLSGAALPLAFFPAGIGKVVSYMPFAGLAQNPVLVLLMKGDTTITSNFYLSSLHILALTLLWYVVLELINKAMFSVASKKVTVQGG